MIPGTWNVTIYKGAQFHKVLTWKDPAGNPYDLAGWSAIFRVTELDADELLTITPTLGGALGTITLAMTTAETAALDFSRGNHSLDMINPSSETTRLLQGSVVVDSP